MSAVDHSCDLFRVTVRRGDHGYPLGDVCLRCWSFRALRDSDVERLPSLDVAGLPRRVQREVLCSSI